MDPIADMFSQISNIKNSDKSELILPYSNIKMAILGILKDTGKINSFEISKDNKYKKIEINLSKAYFKTIRRISSPGKRVYIKRTSLLKPKSPQGIIIISTSKGLMTSEDAQKKGLGGEVICEVI